MAQLEILIPSLWTYDHLPLTVDKLSDVNITARPAQAPTFDENDQFAGNVPGTRYQVSIKGRMVYDCTLKGERPYLVRIGLQLMLQKGWDAISQSATPAS